MDHRNGDYEKRFLEYCYSLAQKHLTVIIRQNYGKGFIQASFTWPPSDRIARDRATRKQIDEKVAKWLRRLEDQKKV